MVVSAAVSTSSPVSPTVTAIVRRRRPDPWKTSFFVVAVVALVGGVAWALLGSSFFVVRSVQVGGRSWPDSIVIAVVPRAPTFLVRAGRGYEVIDSYGVVLGHAPWPHAGLVLLTAPAWPATALRGNSAVLAAGAVVRRLPGWLRHRLAEVRVRQGSNVILILRPRITVVWGGAARAAAKAAELAVLVRTKATYFDVSDPGSAVTGWPAGG